MHIHEMMHIVFTKKKDDAYRGDFFFAVQHFSSRAKNLDALNKTTMYATHWSSLLFEL
jgi:hypothetical protein